MLEPYPRPPEMNVRVMDCWYRGIWGSSLWCRLMLALAVAWMLCLALVVVWMALAAAWTLCLALVVVWIAAFVDVELVVVACWLY